MLSLLEILSTVSMTTEMLPFGKYHLLLYVYYLHFFCGQIGVEPELVEPK